MTLRHPYRDGNYAPVQTEVPLTKCNFSLEIPLELAGGMYIRNGSNPASTQSPSASRSQAEPSYHWVNHFAFYFLRLDADASLAVRRGWNARWSLLRVNARQCDHSLLR